MEAKRGRRSQAEPPHQSTVMNHRREERRSPTQVERLSETWRDFWGSCRSGTRWGRGDESRRWLAVREARTPVLTSLDGAGPLTPCTPAVTRLFCMSTSLICPPPACWWDQVMLTLCASTCTLACLDYPVKHLLLSLWPWLGLSLRCKKINLEFLGTDVKEGQRINPSTVRGTKADFILSFFCILHGVNPWSLDKTNANPQKHVKLISLAFSPLSGCLKHVDWMSWHYLTVQIWCCVLVKESWYT